MYGVGGGVPVAAIQVIAVLGQSGEVADAEVAASAWPILVVRGGFAEIVVACPYKFSDYPRIVLLTAPVVVGKVAPRAVFGVVAGALAVGVGVLVRYSHGELINTAGAYRGCRLAAKEETFGQLLDIVFIFVDTIVESGYIHHLGKT